MHRLASQYASNPSKKTHHCWGSPKASFHGATSQRRRRASMQSSVRLQLWRRATTSHPFAGAHLGRGGRLPSTVLTRGSKERWDSTTNASNLERTSHLKREKMLLWCKTSVPQVKWQPCRIIVKLKLFLDDKGTKSFPFLSFHCRQKSQFQGSYVLSTL